MAKGRRDRQMAHAAEISRVRFSARLGRERERAEWNEWKGKWRWRAHQSCFPPLLPSAVSSCLPSSQSDREGRGGSLLGSPSKLVNPAAKPVILCPRTREYAEMTAKLRLIKSLCPRPQPGVPRSRAAAPDGNQEQASGCVMVLFGILLSEGIRANHDGGWACIAFVMELTGSPRTNCVGLAVRCTETVFEAKMSQSNSRALLR
ncbi:hypothetical protein B0H67DRAFT_591113 [Lasiosphaeris hirsuta]|uniref:Uncharacterized protein n=1 Tax=Lasiosphaeris hirsuta TaxID=260670 RepID=A0AA39ZVJ0_9PEZI|nr:hypothetical protein B0H67DRAFT_591113 [Lasiosphaeris hirsuta]